MNSSVYLFGEFNKGYNQYPNDYTASIFKEFYAKSKANTQVVIHRDDNLMYYGYIRKLENNHYIGLCVILHGLCLKRVDSVFEVFENVISNLVYEGSIINYNDQGRIVSNLDDITISKQEFEKLTNVLRHNFDQLEKHSAILPPVSYGISKDSEKSFDIKDSVNEIITSTYQNGYTYIYKSKGYNTARMNSYEGVLSRLSEQNTNLKAENDSLQTKIKKVERQKQQFTLVLFLVFIMFIGGFIFYNTIEHKNSDIISQQDTIRTKSKENIELKNSNTDLVSNLNNLRDDNKKLQSQLQSLQTELSDLNNKYNNLNNKYNNSISESNRLKQSLSQLNKTIAQNILDISELQGQNTALSKTISRKQNSISDLTKQYDILSRLFDMLKEECRKTKDGRKALKRLSLK